MVNGARCGGAKAQREIHPYRGSRIVIPKIALYAGVVCIGLLVVGVNPAAAVDAQSTPPGSEAGVPPYEVLTIVRSMGLEPLTRPVRNGPAYALRAVDSTGQEVRVVIDARRGR